MWQPEDNRQSHDYNRCASRLPRQFVRGESGSRAAERLLTSDRRPAVTHRKKRLPFRKATVTDAHWRSNTCACGWCFHNLNRFFVERFSSRLGPKTACCSQTEPVEEVKVRWKPRNQQSVYQTTQVKYVSFRQEHFRKCLNKNGRYKLVICVMESKEVKTSSCDDLSNGDDA